MCQIDYIVFFFEDHRLVLEVAFASLALVLWGFNTPSEDLLVPNKGLSYLVLLLQLLS